jgi:hypothetical protein
MVATEPTSDLIGRGAFASRPSAGIAGRIYIPTDVTAVMYRDNGASWDTVALGAIEDWQSYTPTLTGSGSNPTLGSGSSATGRYQRNGKTITGRADILFGSSGVAAGTGQYIISLPVAAAVPLPRAMGTAILFDSSAGLFYTGVVYQGTTASNARVALNNNASLVASTGTPFTEAANDQFWLEFAYEAAA